MTLLRRLSFCLVIALIAGAGPRAQEPVATTQPADDLAPRSEVSVLAASSPTGPPRRGKIVIYQAMARLFGNQSTTNQPWGSSAANGVGKFDDFNDAALRELHNMGVSHLWLTGVLRHAMVLDAPLADVHSDDPDVVKGRAGSPYAIKDYYDVNPDLAIDPAGRRDEFAALLQRAHRVGLKVLIDLVPNHVARNYQSLAKPAGVVDFGANEDTSVAYARDNNFSYLVGQRFIVPEGIPPPLGGAAHPLADGKYDEFPARVTGNGAARAQPKADDWYETVKLNFGVRPDGSHDFPTLPEDFARRTLLQQDAYWAEQDVPNTWAQFAHIARYWLDVGVDGFRYDMAEMVPVEFWNYLNTGIKTQRPDALLLAEVYNPARYRDFIYTGRMDYLYDKVGFYDALRPLMAGTGTAAAVIAAHQSVEDIAPHMLHFLENHDEQRIGSPEFAGDAAVGKPGMLISAAIGSGPLLLYFGQEVGEDGSETGGFGQPSRTSIFDYVGVPAHQRWMHGGAFDGGGLTPAERELRGFYVRLLQLVSGNAGFKGQSDMLNVTDPIGGDKVIATLRAHGAERVVSVANFDRDQRRDVLIALPKTWVWSELPNMETGTVAGAKSWGINVKRGRPSTWPPDLQAGESITVDLLTDEFTGHACALLQLDSNGLRMRVRLPPAGAMMFWLTASNRASFGRECFDPSEYE